MQMRDNGIENIRENIIKWNQDDRGRTWPCNAQKLAPHATLGSRLPSLGSRLLNKSENHKGSDLRNLDALWLCVGAWVAPVKAAAAADVADAL